MINKIPKNWSEITFEEYRDINIILKEDINDLDKIIKIITILLDLNYEEYDKLYEIKYNEIRRIKNKIKFLTDYPKDYKKNINIQGVEYELINLNYMTLAEWIQLEHYITNDIEYNAHLICSVLYRRFRYDEFNNKILEEFNYNMEERSNLFLKSKMDSYPLELLLDFRYDVMNKFVLNKNDDDDIEEEINVEELNYRDRVEYNEEINRSKLQSIFNYELLILNLTDNDIQKSYDLLKMPVLYIFKIITIRNILN